MDEIREDEVLTKDEYERRRPEFRRHIMKLKNARRMAVGEHMTVHFETRDTMLYQIHEMLRAEDSWQRPGAIDDELAAYNPLVPSGGELSATVMLEYETAEERDLRLTELLGLDHYLWLEIADTEPVAAVFDSAQVSPTRISSVQYVRWPIDAERSRLLRTDGTVVRIRSTHPAYQAQAVVSEETRKELAKDRA